MNWQKICALEYLSYMYEENWSDQDEGATEDNTFANKTFLSIDERFALNATSMLDQPKS